MEGEESCRRSPETNDAQLRHRKPPQRTRQRNGYCNEDDTPNDVDHDLMSPHQELPITDETCTSSSTSYDESGPSTCTDETIITQEDNPGSLEGDSMSNGRTFGSTGPVLSDSLMKTEIVIMEFTFKPLIVFTLFAPLSAMIITFAIGFSTDYDQLLNYEWTCGKVLLPSFSRIVNLPKERIVWNMWVLSHVVTRPFLVAVNYRLCSQAASPMPYPRLHSLAAWSIVVIGMLEILSIPWLTTIGEREEPEYHVYFFIMFGVSSLCYFLITSAMFGASRHYVECKKAALSYRLKIIFAVLYLVLLPSVFLLFTLYWQMCYNFAYDFFAAFEYITMLVNFGFHATSVLDCNDVYQLRVPITSSR